MLILLTALYDALRPDFKSNLVYGSAFGTPKVYMAPYGKINHRLVNHQSYNSDMKLGLRVNLIFTSRICLLVAAGMAESAYREPLLAAWAFTVLQIRGGNMDYLG